MLLNILYLLGLIGISPIIVYRNVRHGRYRRGWSEKLFGKISVQKKTVKRIWFHAVSVGEVNVLRGLVRQFQQRFPDREIVVSVSTDTGYDLARQHFGDSRVFFAPLDFTWAVRGAFKRIDPDLLVLTELEIWPNWIRQANRNDVPIAVVNGRLSQRSHRNYQRCGAWIRSLFQNLSFVGCQDAVIADRFVNLGVPAEQISITGSIKYDDAPSSRDAPEVLRCIDLAQIQPWHRVWVAGSTQAGEEEIILQTYQAIRKDYPDIRLVIVPRHKERFDEVARLIERYGLRVQRRSKIKQTAGGIDLTSDRVLLVDTIGELRNWWGTAYVAFVGGSLGNRGGQNMLEPAGYGAAVCFGPNTRNFQDIVTQLLRSDAAVVVHDQTDLQTFLNRCLENPPAADSLGRAARQVIAAHQGATERTLAGLSCLVTPAKAIDRRAA